MGKTTQKTVRRAMDFRKCGVALVVLLSLLLCAGQAQAENIECPSYITSVHTQSPGPRCLTGSNGSTNGYFGLLAVNMTKVEYPSAKWSFPHRPAIRRSFAV